MRRKHKSKRIMAGMLCAVLLISALSGCTKEDVAKITIQPMEAETPDVYGIDFLGGTDVMPIAGYYGPMPSNYSVDGQSLPDYISDEFMADIQAAGFNLLNHQYTYYGSTPREVMELLDLAEKYGMAVCVYDERIIGFLGEETLSVEEIDTLVSEYRDHPAFCGLYVVDEPGCDYYFADVNRPISNYGTLFSRLKELDIFSYSNIFPMLSYSGKDNYEKYVKEFMDTCDVYYLAWDKYVWDKGNDLKDYFANMSICRKYAEEAKIPFWPFIQAGSQWNTSTTTGIDTDGYYPSEGQLWWNVNTCLAYGAKGLQYFPLIQPNYYSYAISKPYDLERNGIFGMMGNKNRWYYYAQNVNKQVAAVDEVLMNSVNKGIIATGEQAIDDNTYSDYMIKGESWRELTGVKGDTLIGCFNYQGKSAYYVVNYDTEYAQKIVLNFADNYDMSVTQNAEKTYVNTKTLELTMAAGEGVLVVIE